MDPALVLTPVLWLGAGLLVYAGAAKLVVPDAAMATLHKLRLPSGRLAARALATAEVAAGITVVVAGGLVAAVTSALVWAGLTIVAVVHRARHIDCACFGVRRYPVSRAHVAANAVMALTGVAGLVAAPWSLTQVAADAGAVGVAAAVMLVGSGVMVLTTLIERAGLAAHARGRVA